MHRYREFGLISDRDETLRRAVRDGFKHVGLSHRQFLDALAWYRDHVGPATDEAALRDAFAEFAAGRQWPPELIAGAVAVYEGIRDGGPAAAPLPTPDEDRATLARGDEALRREPARYWRDAELQDAVFEARERLEALAETSTSHADTTSPAGARAREIEAMLQDKSGAGQRRYWSNPALREDYARALAAVQGDSGALRAEASAAAATGAAAAESAVVPPPASA